MWCEGDALCVFNFVLCVCVVCVRVCVFALCVCSLAIDRRMCPILPQTPEPTQRLQYRELSGGAGGVVSR